MTVLRLTLHIYNSHCDLLNLSINLVKSLSRSLSYEIPGAYFSNLPWYARFKCLLTKGPKGSDIHRFPTGLLHIVLEWCQREHVEYELLDRRQRPSSTQVFRCLNRKKLPALRPYQEEILKLCIKDERGVIEAATGTGKTRIVLELVERLSLPTLIVVPSSAILGQTYALACDYFGKRLVGQVGDGKKQNDRLITIANYQALESMDSDFWNRVDVLIIDEHHHSAAETIQELNRTQFQKIYHRFGFTATNFRNDGTDLALQGVLSNVIFCYDIIKATAEGYLTPAIACVLNFDQDQSLVFGNWKAEYKARIIENEVFHAEVANVIALLLKNKLPTVVFVDEIAHGRRLVELIPGAVFINGENPTKENKQSLQDFNDGKLNCIVGTSIIGEGIDLARAACGVMAGGGKAYGTIQQRVGRLLRLHSSKKLALMVDWLHNGSKYPLKHSKRRVAVYKDLGLDIFDDLLLTASV